MKVKHEGSVGVPSLILRSYLSKDYIWAAHHFARLTGQVEAERRPGFYLDHRAYVTGAVLHSVAFLEAVINEMFVDVAHGHQVEQLIEILGDDAVSQTASMWALVKDRGGVSTLGKFQMALLLARKQEFDAGTPPYQDVDLLIKLRNALVHFEPESAAAGQPADQEDMQKMEQKLGKKFLQNELMQGVGNPYFPDKCLGFGCAKWAAESSLTFADDFLSRIGVTPRYEAVRAELVID